MTDEQTIASPPDRPTVPPPPPRSFPWRRLVLGLLILAVGFASGLAASVLFRRQIFHYMRGADTQRRHMPLIDRTIEMLRLDPRQENPFREIFNRHWTAMLAIEQLNRPMIDREMDEMDKEVRAILQPEQLREWPEIVERMRFFVPVRLAGETSRAARPDAPPMAPPGPPPHEKFDGKHWGQGPKERRGPEP